MTHRNNGHETAAYLMQTAHAPGERLAYPSIGARRRSATRAPISLPSARPPMNAPSSAPVAWCDTPKSTANPRKYAASHPSATPPDKKKSGATTANAEGARRPPRRTGSLTGTIAREPICSGAGGPSPVRLLRLRATTTSGHRRRRQSFFPCPCPFPFPESAASP